MTIRSLHRQSGLNLIEILVAALILSIGLLSLAGLQVASLKSVQNATQKQQAAFMIHELFERMRANRVAVLSGGYNTNGVDCANPPSALCDGSASCTPEQIATFDLYSVQCGNNAEGAVNSGISGQLMSGSLSVACISDDPSDCSGGVRVGLTWVERISDKQLDTDENTETYAMSIDAVI